MYVSLLDPKLLTFWFHNEEELNKISYQNDVNNNQTPGLYIAITNNVE